MSFKDEIERAAIDRGEIEERGVKFTYYVLPASYASLRNFVGYQDGVLLISEETPAEFRPYVLVHEILCRHIFAARAGHCLRAFQIELMRVPRELHTRYLLFRRDFFRALVAHRASMENDPLRKEIAATLDALERIVHD